PCVSFSGSNGGETSRGVTDKEIIVAVRILNEKGFQETLAALAGAEISDNPSDIKRTISALQVYFNKYFQFYGRKIKIVYYNGKGSSTDELLGGGQAEAQADAINVSQTIKAFAELNGATAPFSDALARQKVIAFGSPYLSRKWHLDHRPWNWSIASDCSVVAETAAEYYVNLLAGKNAAYAGPGLEGKRRVLAGLSPENPWYAECHDDFEKYIRDHGHNPEVRINYRLDINSMSNQAANVVAQLKSAGATSIFCGCDPIFPVFLTTKAAEQNYNPEWVVVGVALTDHDLVGQLYDQEQWSRAAGVSYAGSVLPQRAGLGYAAYKSVRKDEPAFSVEIIYAQMYMLALGLQLAGPTLTPDSYEAGMFSYPGGTGIYGTWGFPQGSYTPQRDTRIIWWDPEKTSSFNRKKGSYVEAYGGKRFGFGKLPKGEPQLFDK
ncbi:MAG: ABC transporter substrate-binding protein, partial [Actinomycetota bacterium]